MLEISCFSHKVHNIWINPLHYGSIVAIGSFNSLDLTPAKCASSLRELLVNVILVVGRLHIENHLWLLIWIGVNFICSLS